VPCRVRIADRRDASIRREFVTSMDRDVLVNHLRTGHRFLAPVTAPGFRRWKVVHPQQVTSAIDVTTGLNAWPEQASSAVLTNLGL
jgi:hypothetical protein